MRIRRQASFLSDLITTQITAIATMVAMVVVTRLLAQRLGPEEFGVYSLARRIVLLAVPLATLWLGTAVTRFVAMSRDLLSSRWILFSGIRLMAIPTVAVVLSGVVFAHPLSRFIFGSGDYWSVCAASSIMLLGQAFYYMLYSYYRGTRQMLRANLWQLLISVTMPLLLAVAFAAQGKVALIVGLWGAASTIVVLPLAYLTWPVMRMGGWQRTPHVARQLLRYGVPRIPSGFALPAMLTIGPFLASRYLSLREAGYLVVGQSLLLLSENILSAFPLVVLPKAAQLLTEKRDDAIRETIGIIIAFIFQAGLFCVLHLMLWSDQVILTWLGKDYAAAIPISRLFVLAVLPYAAYVMLRSIIDAVEEKAVNTRNLLVALAAACVSCWILVELHLGVLGLGLGTVIGFTVLGGATLRYTVKHLHMRTCPMLTPWVLLLNGVCLISAFAIKTWFESQWSGWTLVLLAMTFELSLGTAYFLVLRALNASWIMELEKRLRPTTAQARPGKGKGAPTECFS